MLFDISLIKIIRPNISYINDRPKSDKYSHLTSFKSQILIIASEVPVPKIKPSGWLWQQVNAGPLPLSLSVTLAINFPVRISENAQCWSWKINREMKIHFLKKKLWNGNYIYRRSGENIVSSCVQTQSSNRTIMYSQKSVKKKINFKKLLVIFQKRTKYSNYFN